MKIKLFQINMERDERCVAMMGYEEFLERLDSEEIDCSIYDLVFDGEVEDMGLEDIYTKFHVARPEEYMGRVMLVSDVVQVLESTSIKAGFYFCDSIGYKEIHFHPEQACLMMN